MSIFEQLQSNGNVVEKVWLKPEPDSTIRKPYLRVTNRYGKTWLVPLG